MNLEFFFAKATPKEVIQAEKAIIAYKTGGEEGVIEASFLLSMQKADAGSALERLKEEADIYALSLMTEEDEKRNSI